MNRKRSRTPKNERTNKLTMHISLPSIHLLLPRLGLRNRQKPICLFFQKKRKRSSTTTNKRANKLTMHISLPSSASQASIPSSRSICLFFQMNRRRSSTTTNKRANKLTKQITSIFCFPCFKNRQVNLPLL